MHTVGGTRPILRWDGLHRQPHARRQEQIPQHGTQCGSCRIAASAGRVDPSLLLPARWVARAQPSLPLEWWHTRRASLSRVVGWWGECFTSTWWAPQRMRQRLFALSFFPRRRHQCTQWHHWRKSIVALKLGAALLQEQCYIMAAYRYTRARRMPHCWLDHASKECTFSRRTGVEDVSERGVCLLGERRRARPGAGQGDDGRGRHVWFSLHWGLFLGLGVLDPLLGFSHSLGLDMEESVRVGESAALGALFVAWLKVSQVLVISWVWERAVFWDVLVLWFLGVWAWSQSCGRHLRLGHRWRY